MSILQHFQSSDSSDNLWAKGLQAEVTERRKRCRKRKKKMDGGGGGGEGGVRGGGVKISNLGTQPRQ